MLNFSRGIRAVLFTFLIADVAGAQGSYPYDTRTDSIAVSHYDVALDVRDVTGTNLKGQAAIFFEALVDGITTIRLDLLGLTVDSVLHSGNQLSFTQGAQAFTVSLGETFNEGQFSDLEVFYHGNPVEDPAFGGFYFNPNYAYNIGVSLDDIPHNYGKTWFPCFDNFITRSTYHLSVTAPSGKKTSCGGLHLSSSVNPDLSETHHWEVNQTIPAYLVSVAVANFVYVNDTFTDLEGDPVPVMLAAKASDTTNVKNSFVNLESAFDIYEDKFGPYRWDRVGYAFVPITAGAMEHAMNIAYPISLAGGNLLYQSVMAHELSHHWWGNLVTCRTAEDMWINEGSAAYCEYVFREGLDGRAAYESEVRGSHKSLLQSCHITDEGYWPLSGIPQEHTYSTTTYSKGADIIHTLRGYLGDSLFFNGLKTLLEQNQFSDMDAIEYRDKLAAITGVDLTNFFADWIFQGGWPHVSIDSLKSVPAGGNYDVTIYLKQKLAGRTQFSHDVPMTVTFRDNNWNSFEARILSDGEHNAVTVSVPFLPTAAYLNRDELISHAVTGVYETVTETGTQSVSHALGTLMVQTVADSALFVLEHHWVAADPVRDWSLDYTISPERFWRVEGIFPDGFSTNLKISYNGSGSGSGGYLDEQLITGSEDSLILLYRPDRATDWVECSGYTKTTGSNLNDKQGSMTINNVKKGEYAFAMKGPDAGVKELNEQHVTIRPNPTLELITVESALGFDELTVIDIQGRQVIVPAQGGQLDFSALKSGTYVVSGWKGGVRVFSKQVIRQ